MKSTVKKISNLFGYDILHLPTDSQVRRKRDLFKKYGIDLILDVGANRGQYSFSLRKMGYTGKIVSFEPLPDAYFHLYKNSIKDKKWIVHNLALGNYNGKITIHKSANSYSSSALDMLPRHLKSAPNSNYIEDVVAQITTLDNMASKLAITKNNVLLKIDTQGYEYQVLLGGNTMLKQIIGIQIEMSLIPLFSGELLIGEMLKYLKSKGFILMQLENGHMDYSNGEILQVDGLFFRK